MKVEYVYAVLHDDGDNTYHVAGICADAYTADSYISYLKDDGFYYVEKFQLLKTNV